MAASKASVFGVLRSSRRSLARRGTISARTPQPFPSRDTRACTSGQSFHSRSISRSAGPEVRCSAPDSGSARAGEGSLRPIPWGSRPKMRSVEPEIRSRHPEIRSRSRLGCSGRTIPCSGRIDPPAISARRAGDRSAGAGDRPARAGESRRARRGSLSSEQGIAVLGAGEGHFDSRGSVARSGGPLVGSEFRRRGAPSGTARALRARKTAMKSVRSEAREFFLPA